MLNVFRSNVKRFAPILWVVIAVFILLVFTDYSNQDRRGTSADTAATVGKYEVSFDELQRSYSQLEQVYRNQFGDAYTSELGRQMGLPLQAVNRVVNSKLQRDEARDLGLLTTDDELQQVILETPLFQNETGGFVGPREYEERIQRTLRTTVDRFEEDLRSDLLDSKIQSILSDAVWVSDKELEEQAREEAERAKIRYLRLDGSAVADQVEVQDAEIATYFEENQADYQLPETRRVAYLSINVNTVRATLEVSDEELRAYYDANPGEFSREEQVRARHILLFVNDDRTAEQAQSQLEAIKARIEGGEDFGAIAQQVSEDEASKTQGGDLGFFGRGRMTPQFEQAAFGGEQGEIVGPIENQLGPRTGYHLIEIIAKQEGGLQPFEEVANRIRVRQLNERSQSATEEKARELASRLSASPPQGEEALREVAQTEGVAVEVLEPFGADDNIPGIGRGTAFSRAVFDAEPGQLTEPLQIPTGWALAQVLSVQEPRVPELDEVRGDVRSAIVAEKQVALAQERLAALKDQVASGDKTLEQAGEELGAPVEETAEFGAADGFEAVPGAVGLNQAALELEAGEIGGPVETASGAVLFEVIERTHFDPATFETEKDQKRGLLRQQRFGQLVGSWLQSRLDELDVQYTPAMVEMFELEAQLGTDS